MDRKEFKSRLFNRKIAAEDKDYWAFMHAEVLYRLKQLEELNCTCSFCFRDRIYLKGILQAMANDNHIEDNPKPKNFTGKGDCGRKLGNSA